MNASDAKPLNTPSGSLALLQTQPAFKYPGLIITDNGFPGTAAAEDDGPATTLEIATGADGEHQSPVRLLDTLGTLGTLGALGALEHRGGVSVERENGVRYYDGASPDR